MKKLALFFISILCVLSAFSQQIDASILQSRWKAFWVDVPSTDAHTYGVYHFRKTFNLAEKPAHFIVHVSADNRYKLFVNGVQVSFGPARADVYNWNFETVNIAAQLKAGDNTIAAVVWNFGYERQEAQISFQTGFILQGNTDAEAAVNTNNTWKCIQDAAYSPLQPQLIYTYYAAGPAEKVDYNTYPSGWQAAGFDDSQWKPAHQLQNGLPKGVFAYALGWMLVPRPIPAMELTQQRLNVIRSSKGADVTNSFLQGGKSFTVAPNTKVSVLIDQQYLTTAFPVINFSKGKNAIIDLSYAEGLYVDEGNNRDWRAQSQKGNRNEIEGKRFVGVKDEVISGGKEAESFSPLAFRTYRYMKLDIETKEEAITINDLYGLYTGYPFTYNASFASDDTSLNKILEVGWRTARLMSNYNT
jgi:hypothetical protein